MRVDEQNQMLGKMLENNPHKSLSRNCLGFNDSSDY